MNRRPVEHSKRIRHKAEQHFRLYSYWLDFDPELAEQHWATGKSLQAFADKLRTQEQIEWARYWQEVDYRDQMQTYESVRP